MLVRKERQAQTWRHELPATRLHFSLARGATPASGRVGAGSVHAVVRQRFEDAPSLNEPSERRMWLTQQPKRLGQALHSFDVAAFIKQVDKVVSVRTHERLERYSVVTL